MPALRPPPGPARAPRAAPRSAAPPPSRVVVSGGDRERRHGDGLAVEERAEGRGLEQ
jgi:hypothetical protein